MSPFAVLCAATAAAAVAAAPGVDVVVCVELLVVAPLVLAFLLSDLAPPSDLRLPLFPFPACLDDCEHDTHIEYHRQAHCHMCYLHDAHLRHTVS